MKQMIIFIIAGIALAVGVSPAVADIAQFSSTLTNAAIPAVGLLGMIINKSTLDGLSKNIKTSFQKVFGLIQGLYKDTTMVVPSTGSENDYKWLTDWPAMREWIGDKVINALKGNNYIIANKDFEATIEVDRNDIEDGNLGGVSVQAEMSGQSAGELYDDLDAAVKNAAFAARCYDGQFFYDTDHPVEAKDGSTVSVSNKGTAALSNATLSAAQASYGAARIAIMQLKRDGGAPLGLMPGLLEVPPALEVVAKMLLENEKLADGSPNPYRGTAKLKINSRLSSSTGWMLHVTDKVAKPFIIQERKKPLFVAQTGGDSDSVFLRKKFLYSIEARAASAYGFWQLSYGSDGTT